MDVHSNSRPLLQQSSEDEDDLGSSDFIIGGTSIEQSIATAVGDQEHHDSISSVITTRLMDNDFDDTAAADDDDDVNTNLTKELLRNENAPRDRFNFNYIVFYLLGMTTLLPWNFFITAEDVSAMEFFVYNLCTYIWTFKSAALTSAEMHILLSL